MAEAVSTAAKEIFFLHSSFYLLPRLLNVMGEVHAAASREHSYKTVDAYLSVADKLNKQASKREHCRGREEIIISIY